MGQIIKFPTKKVAAARRRQHNLRTESSLNQPRDVNYTSLWVTIALIGLCLIIILTLKGR